MTYLCRKLLGIKTAAQHHRRAGEQMRHQDHLRDGPERADVQEHSVAADVETMDGVVGNGQKIAVPQHRGLRRACRAAAEIERCKIVAIASRQRLFG